MTYSPIIPITQWETYRLDLNTALLEMIAAFQAVVPNVVRKAWSEIPASLTGEGPFIYLGDINEQISHSGADQAAPVANSLRRTVFSGTVGYVDVAADNQEANDRANTFADYMRELFTANARILGPGILVQTDLQDGSPISQGQLTGFMHLVVVWQYVVLDGRN